MLSVPPFLYSTTCNVGIAKTSPGTTEIFVRVPIEELKRRDTKGVYADRQPGRAQILLGSTFRLRLPEAPDLILDNDSSLTPEEAVRLILDRVSGLDRQAPSANRNVVRIWHEGRNTGAARSAIA